MLHNSQMDLGIRRVNFLFGTNTGQIHASATAFDVVLFTHGLHVLSPVSLSIYSHNYKIKCYTDSY